MNTLASDFRINEMRHIYTDDQAKKASYEGTMNELLAQSIKLRNLLDNTLKTDVTGKQLRKAMTFWDEYLSQHQKFLKRLRPTVRKRWRVCWTRPEMSSAI